MNCKEATNRKETAGGKTLIIYYSKTGFTQRYAEWLGESLAGKTVCDVVSYKERGRVRLGEYDTILFGGGFHAGRINGIKWFRAQVSKLSEQSEKDRRRFAVFATGATPFDAPAVERALRQNFTQKEWESIRVFYLPGGLCYEKMGAFDRLMMAGFRAMLKKTNADSRMRRMVAQSYDLTDRECLAPVVAWCVETS